MAVTQAEAEKTTAIEEQTFAQKDFDNLVVDYNAFKVRQEQLPDELRDAKSRAGFIKSHFDAVRETASHTLDLALKKADAQFALENAKAEFDAAVEAYNTAVGN